MRTLVQDTGAIVTYMCAPWCRCYVCGELSTDSFFTHLGRPICPAHREQLIPTCADCGAKVLRENRTVEIYLPVSDVLNKFGR